MPVLRYFLFVGGALLTLLLAANAYLPALPATEGSQSASTDLSIIRIHSDRKLPERIVLDTTHPTAVPIPTPAASRIAEAPRPQMPAAAEPQKPQMREAFAQLRPNASELRSSEPKQKGRTVAKNHPTRPLYAGQPRIVVAQQPRFGFFW
jgi:hypothetical protein